VNTAGNATGRVIVACALLALGAAPGRAAAAPEAAAPDADADVDMAEARQRFRRATELFEERDYPAALAEFRRAHALAPSFRIRYNVGQVCFLLHDYACALDSFQRYLAEGAGQIPVRRRAEVLRDVAQLEGRVARLLIVTDRPGAEITVDDVVVGTTPLAGPVLVAAGRPRVGARLSAHRPVTRTIEVAGQQTAIVELQLVSEGALPGDAGPVAARAGAGGLSLAARPAPAGRPAGRVTLVSWLVTGALAAAAGTTGVLAVRASSQLERRRGQFGLEGPDELRDRARQTRQLALATDILTGATVVAAGVSLYLTLSRPRRGEGLALRIAPRAVALGGAF
jgi:hypothetical protein